MSIIGIDISWNAETKNNGCQVLFVSETLLLKLLRDPQKLLKVLSDPNWEHYPALKTVIGELYRKLIAGYEALLNKTEAILYQLIKKNSIRTMAKILETLMIRQTEYSSWFNGPIINLLTHIKSIIKVSFLNNFWLFFTAIRNKIKQLLKKKESKHKFECFFKKAYKINAAAAIPELSRLINDNLSLDLT